MEMQKYSTGLNSTEIAVFFDGKHWHWSYTAACDGELVTFDSLVKYADQTEAISAGFAHFSRITTASVFIKLVADFKKSKLISRNEAMKLEKSVDDYLKNFY